MTTPEIIALVVAVAPVLAGAIYVIRRYFNWRARKWKQRAGILEQEIEALKNQLHGESAVQQIQEMRSQIKVLRGQLEDDRKVTDKIQTECDLWEKATAGGLAELKEVSFTLQQAQEELEVFHREEKSRSNLVRRALKLEGRIWEQKALRGIPRFRALTERHAAIISVLNLKGGVGKTTIAGNLAAAFSGRGYRVLLVDLDLQGSLSSLFVPRDKLTEHFKRGTLLQNFLAKAALARKANLLEYATPILDGRSALVAATDSLAYAELNLTMQWLLRDYRRDVRFLLRRGLHQKRITSHFDLVLLDCPPLINTCCVNALAASDYVLVPVNPSRKSGERVPQLLHTLKKLSAVVNHDLSILGLVANRTRTDQMSAWERDFWAALRDQCTDQWGEPVYAFNRLIRQNVQIPQNEEEFVAPEKGTDLFVTFDELATEMEGRLPSDCRRTSEVPT